MIKLTIQSIPPVAELEVEAGSIAEAVAIFADGGSKVLGEFFQQVIAAAVGAQTSSRTLTIPAAPTGQAEPNLAAEVEGGAADTVEEQGADGKPTRRRRTKLEMAAARAAEAAAAANPTPSVPPLAVAPAPMPIPALAGPTAPPLPIGAPGIQPPGFVTGRADPAVVPLRAVPDANVEVLGSGIPTIRQRTAPPPPPPPLPAPPVLNLAPKVIENLKARGESPDLLAWLVTTGLCTTQAKWSEALDVISFTTDDKLRPTASALGVTA